MKVLAIDPGPHVGVASWDDGDFQAFEMTPAELYAAAPQWVAWADVVVVESFHISGSRAASANETIEMIGVLRYLAAGQRKQFVLQSPSDASGFSTNEKLRAVGMWVKGSDHARSAAKHLLMYAVRARLQPREDLLRSAQEEES